MILIPSLGITAITAAANVALQLHSMTLMITFLEAVLADDACWIFFAIEAAPGDITCRQLFCANCGLTVLINKSQHLRVVRLVTGSINLDQAVFQKLFKALDNLIARFAIG